MRVMRAVCCVATTITIAPCTFSDVICVAIPRWQKMKDMHFALPVAPAICWREEGVRGELSEPEGGDWLDVGE